MVGWDQWKSPLHIFGVCAVTPAQIEALKKSVKISKIKVSLVAFSSRWDSNVDILLGEYSNLPVFIRCPKDTQLYSVKLETWSFISRTPEYPELSNWSHIHENFQALVTVITSHPEFWYPVQIEEYSAIKGPYSWPEVDVSPYLGLSISETSESEFWQGLSNPSNR